MNGANAGIDALQHQHLGNLVKNMKNRNEQEQLLNPYKQMSSNSIN
jgi:hypothetical protein